MPTLFFGASLNRKNFPNELPLCTTLSWLRLNAHNDLRSFEADGPANGTSIRGILEGPAAVTGRNLVQLGIHGFMNSS
jgi:hypothetical protein